MGSFLGGRSDRWEFWTSIALLTAADILLPMLHVRAAVAALFVMWLVTWARRLHDIDLSAWVGLIPAGLMVALIGLGVFLGGHEFSRELSQTMARRGSANFSEFDFMMWIVLASVFVQYGFTIWLGIMSGDPGDNRFGPPHRARIVEAKK